MVGIKLNDSIPERDFEIAYLKDITLNINKLSYFNIDFESARQLYKENIKRKRYLGYDYYLFDFTPEEKDKIEKEFHKVVDAKFTEKKPKRRKKVKK